MRESEWSDPSDGSPSARRLARSLGLTIASVVLPGVAHAAAGRRKTALLLLTGYFLLIATAVIGYVGLGKDGLLGLGLDTRVLHVASLGAATLAVLWPLTVISSYAVNRPRAMSAGQHLLGGLVVLSLCVATATPFVVAAGYASTGRETIRSNFGDSTGRIGGVDKEDAFANRPRINILLIGGDGGKGRDSIRNDSNIVASIDTKTGETLMISLPRNLYGAPFPAGSVAESEFPDGFAAPPGESRDNYLLNGMYRYGLEHPSIVPDAEHPGADLVSQAVSEILGLKIDYFVLVNLDGFADIVDALGGIQIRVAERTAIGGSREKGIPPHSWIEPNLYKDMDGFNALWYARSRWIGDDYDRMIRQRCVMGAIARQADPQTVLLRFNRLAEASKGLILTNIPPNMLSPLSTLGLKGDSAKITGVSVDKSVFGGSSLTPDYEAILAQAKKWVREADRSAKRTLAKQQAAASPSPSGSPTASPGSGEPAASSSPTVTRPTSTATATSDPHKAKPIEKSCKYE